MFDFVHRLESLERRLAHLPLYLHGLLALLAFALTRWTNAVLDANYAASQYPVPFYVGQLAFDDAKLKGYYAYMLERGTLDLYWRTQLIDFGFIVAVFLAGLIVSLWLARLHAKGTILYKLSKTAALLIPLGALFDVIENLLSFVMLSQPTSFPSWLAPVYSSLAVLKFTAIGAGYMIWLCAIPGFILMRLLKRRERKDATAH